MQPKKHVRPTIGVLAGWQVFTGTPDSFLRHVFLGIQAAAHDRNCNLLMACGIDSGQPAWPLVSPEVAFVPVGPWNTDGLIIVSPFASEAGDRYAKDLIASGFPAIYAGDRDAGPAVVADNAGGIRQALEHLVEHGHRQIAFVAGRQAEHGDSGVRLRAFEAELHALNLPFDLNLIAFGSHTNEGGRQAIQQIISRGTKFTAVMASNDRSAIGVLDGLRQAGLVVPQDIALIGFDDRLESRALVPSLTTVHYPMFGLGYQAVELLLRAINGEKVVNELIHIPTRLVIRELCGCLPGIPVSTRTEVDQTQKSLEITKELVVLQLTQLMTAAVHKESLWLSQEEVAYLGQRLVEALLLSLEQNDPLTFHLMIRQILEHVSARGDDLFAWQAAVTILRDQLPLIRQVVPMQLSYPQEEDMLHQVRVAISEAARGRSTRSLLYQAREADQVGLMTSKLFAADDESEIFTALSKELPSVGIRGAAVGYYEADGDDPVGWSVLQTSVESIAGASHPEARVRFPSRQFPPTGLFPAKQAYQLAILPLKIESELSGFVAFEASNFDPCADIVRQLGAALRGVRLYREAVEARQLAEEGKRLAEEADRLKSRFLSMVSHELRTPLNLITGLSKILLDEYDVEAEHPKASSHDSLKEDLQRIFFSAQHLDGLIRDVLDLASSDVGQLKLVCEPLDMTEVLKTVSAIGEQLARDKGLIWCVEIAKNLPLVWGDRTRLRQVTLNLVSNAVKFTAHGEVKLVALVEDGQVTVSVEDTGLGIPLHEQSIIFDEFRQSERTTARGYGGLGLGLAICWKLVEMHGGQIGVRSSGTEGEGSKFYFSLPVIERQTDLSAKPVSVSEAQRVLLLVKDAGGSRMLQEALKQRGYEVELCVIEKDSDWLASLLLAAPDVVVLDLGLTSECGWEILKIMKENPATKDIPVLFYSIAGDAKHGSLLEIDYLTKPVRTTALTEMLTSKGFFSPAGNQDNGKVILVVDDEPGMVELHTRIVKSQLPDYRVLSARDGRQALQIIAEEHPALVLLDLMMPVLDGFVVLEEMRKTEQTREYPGCGHNRAGAD